MPYPLSLQDESLDNTNSITIKIEILCLYDNTESFILLERLITPSAAASARAGLRSAESMTVAVPCTLSSLGDRSFATAGPRAWNKLPSHLRLIQSADTFRHHLTTFSFHQAFLS